MNIDRSKLRTSAFQSLKEFLRKLHIYKSMGDYEEAKTAYQTAAIFRPDLPFGVLGLSRLALLRGDYQAARQECKKAQEKYAGNPQPLITLAVIEFFSRNFSAAQDLYRKACSLNRAGDVDSFGSVRFLSALGFIQRTIEGDRTGDTLLEEARALDEKDLSKAPDNSRCLYSLAAGYAALGNSEQTNEILEKAIAAGWIDYRSIELDPRFDSVRETPAFARIVIQLKERILEMRQRLPNRNVLAQK